MKRFISVFLCLILCFSIVVPASAAGLDPDTNGYSFDALPYLDSTFVDISPLPNNGAIALNLSLPDITGTQYISGLVETDATDFYFSCNNSYLTQKSVSNNLYYIYGSFDSRIDVSPHPLFFTKGSNGSFINFLSLEITPIDYITHDIDINYNLNFSYTYNHWPYGPSENPIINSVSYNETFTASSFPYSINTPLIHSNTGEISDNFVINDQNVFITSFLYFDWTKFDRVDIYFFNGYDSVTDYSFYVDSINVVDSIQSGTIDGNMATIVSLDFSDLDPNLLNRFCYIRFRGYNHVNSAESYQLYYIHNITGFSRTVSNNFWPTWLTKIIDKLDNIFTGRGEDQTAADSFQDTVDEQASQFEDMSNTMNQVERPDIESIDLSTSNMVDTDSVILATNGIGTILENPIILKVILMALTLALAGFVLYGKR